MEVKTRIRRIADPVLNAWWDFQCTERYWRLRNFLNLGNFYARLWAFNTRVRLEQTGTAVSSTWSIVRGAINSLVWAVILFFILTSSETLLRGHVPTIHGWFVDATDWLLESFSSKLTMTGEMYADLLGGVASVAGVFLGLYFTAVSIGVGQQLGALSPKVRQLIVTERKGSLYIKLLTTLTALSFLLWANAATLGNLSYPAVLFILGFSLFVITAFYPLGLQSFFMADPHAIASPVFQSIHGTLRKMRRRSNNSAHPSFDKYHRTKTISDLHILQEVGDLALSSQRRDRAQLSNLLANLYSQVLYYLDFKHSVESSSQWYSRTYQYDDLLMMDDIKGKMLEQFGHVPDPKEEPNPNWLEDEALTFTERMLKDFQTRKDIDGFIELLATVRAYVGNLARRWEVDLALSMYRVVSKYSAPLYNDASLPFLSRLHLSEGAAILQIDIIQQCLQRVIKPDVSAEMEELTSSVFERRSPRSMLVLPAIKSQMENLKTRISSESQIEGRVLTPRWYVSQIIAKTYSEQIINLFNKLATIQNLEISSPPKSPLYEDAAILVLSHQHGIAVASRLSGHDHYYAAFARSLKAYQKISDLPVSEFKEGEHTARFSEVLDKSFDVLSDLLLPVFRSQRDKSLPDFFGLAYYQLVNELYRQLAENEHTRFAKLYPKVLVAAFLARERILDEYKHVDDISVKARYSLEPIVDLMTLGAYAALFSELHSNKALYDSTLAAWVKVLDLVKINTDKCDWLVGVYEVIRSDFRIVSRASIRFYWEQEFLAELRQRNFIAEDHFSGRDEETTEPGTLWMRVLCRGGGEPHENMCEVFLAIYLPQLGASQAVMTRLKSRFAEQIRKDGGDHDDQT